MSAGQNPAPQLPAGYHAGGIVARSRGEEIGYTLTKDEFQTLSEGEISEARAGRDLCIGAFIAGGIGFLACLLNNDWDNFFKPDHPHMLYLCITAVHILIVGGSGVGWIVYQSRMDRTKSNSPYSRLKKRLEDWFKAQEADQQT